MSRNRLLLARVGFTFFSLVCLFLGLGFLKSLTSSWRDAFSSRSWPSVQAVMLSGRVETTPHRPQDYQLHFRYQYSVNGRQWEGTQINAGDVMDTRRFGELERKYEAGRQVTVWYKPSDPSVSVLEPGMTTGHYLMGIVPPVLLLMGAVFGYAAFRVK